jgi:serralysin
LARPPLQIDGELFVGASDILNDPGGSISSVQASASDLFKFGHGFGDVAINDFVTTGVAHDIILLAGDGFSSFSSLQSAISQNGENTVITINVSDTITLENTKSTALTGSDFRFS